MTQKNDRLEAMWQQQEAFMRLLQRKRGFPDFPIDLSSKEGQRFVKDISYECADELHEARQHLKNSKKHRVTELREVDREKYTEELVDALHYLFEIVIASGISLETFHEAYMRKGEVNRERIENGY